MVNSPATGVGAGLGALFVYDSTYVAGHLKPTALFGTPFRSGKAEGNHVMEHDMTNVKNALAILI